VTRLQALIIKPDGEPYGPATLTTTSDGLTYAEVPVTGEPLRFAHREIVPAVYRLAAEVEVVTKRGWTVRRA